MRNRRNKKGSMELSVNSIVILVIAIVIMGLILGFIREKFKQVSVSLEVNEPEARPASTDNPMTLSRETIGTTPGSSVGLKINLYNPSAYYFEDAAPRITCDGLPNLYLSVNPKNINAGEQVGYFLTVTIPRNQGSGKSFLCLTYVNSTRFVNEVCMVDSVLKKVTCPTMPPTACPPGSVSTTTPSGWTMIGSNGFCKGNVPYITPRDINIQIS